MDLSLKGNFPRILNELYVTLCFLVLIFQSTSGFVYEISRFTSFRKTFLVEYEKRSRIHDVKPVENKCMKCREEGTDIVFVMDASNLVTDENWRLQKEFVKKFMKSYKIGKEDNEFLVALVFYGYSQKFFNFVTLLQDYEENEDGIEHAYNLFDRQRYNESSERHLHLGIKQATYMLTHAVHGSRPSGQKIRRAIVVLSSADSAPEYHIQLKYQLAFFDKEVGAWCIIY